MDYLKKMMIATGDMHNLIICKDPTYVGDDYYRGTNVETGLTVIKPAHEVYFYNGPVDTFFNEVKRNWDGGNIELVINPVCSWTDESNKVMLSVLYGRCVLNDLFLPFSYEIQLIFDKGVKITPDVEMKYIPDYDAYRVTTPYARCRRVRYSKKRPVGESYDRIINVLLRGPHTTQEIALETGIEQNRISGRISELKAFGTIRKCGRKKMSSGKHNTLWELA